MATLTYAATLTVAASSNTSASARLMQHYSRKFNISAALPVHHINKMAKSNEDSMLFPQKLMEILGDPDNQKAISWLPSGKAFVIHDRDAFAESVMPKYFSRQAKYSSFTRKLNRWNFQRVSKGPESGAYYHHFFLRDKPHLAAQMFCKNARTILAMATTEKSSNHVAVLQDKQLIPSAFASSTPDQHFGEAAMSLPVSLPVNSLYCKNSQNPSNLNVLRSSDLSNHVHLLDSSLMIAQYQQQQQQQLQNTTRSFGLLDDAMLRAYNDRQSVALSLQQQQQQSAAVAAALEADYLRQIHLQRMVEISMQEMQKRNEAAAVINLGNTRLPSPQRNNNDGSPPSGTKRASAA